MLGPGVASRLTVYFAITRPGVLAKASFHKEVATPIATSRERTTPFFRWSRTHFIRTICFLWLSYSSFNSQTLKFLMLVTSFSRPARTASSSRSSPVLAAYMPPHSLII